MAIRDKIRNRVEPHLEPGETLQAVIPAQSHSAWLMVATGAVPFLIFNTYYVIAVTDRRIMIGKSGSWTATNFREVVATLPRNTTIGPASGLWYKSESLGRRLYIHKRFHADVAHADSLASAAVGGAALEDGPTQV